MGKFANRVNCRCCVATKATSRSDRPTILRELMNASILLALASSLFYLAGISYVNAYLTEWGVHPSLIKLNVQEILVHGFTMLLQGGAYTGIISVSLGIVLFLYLSIALEISKIPFFRKVLSKISKKYKENQQIMRSGVKRYEPPVILQSSVWWSLQFTILGMLFIVLLLMLFSFFKFSSSQGVEQAKKEYVEFSSGKLSNTSIFSRKKIFTIDGIKREGYVLASSEIMVVLYLLREKSEGEKVVVIPLSSISEIQAEKNAT